MNDALLALYHRLPAPAQSLAAGLRGLYLRSWRYGPETELLVEEALERETWTAERWRTWQQDELGRVLERAATRVPYYRSFWQGRPRGAWQDLAAWPLLEKEELRRNPEAFLAEDCNRRRMFPEHTSGTTGKPLELWWSRRTVRHWYALFEARCRRWHGLSRRDRWALLGGQLVTPRARRRPPFWVWNAALGQLYLSSYHLAPDLIRHYGEALARYRVRYVLGYTSSLYALAAAGVRVPLQAAITNAEPVEPYQREAIGQALGCPVQETYGMAEIVAGASECRHGRLHLWPEVGLVEVAGGDLVCTGLLNQDMPLVRYRVGDRGTLESGAAPCACGRTLPVLAVVEGRSDDVLYTRDGRSIGRLDPAFKTRLPIQEAQIIQEALGRLRVRYVPAPGFNGAAARALVERLQARLGDVEVELEALDAIPREPNGKFRAVICRIR